jgi:poly(A) polymerase
VRFAAKLGFRIDPASEVQVPLLAHLLQEVPGARLYEEVLKLFHGGTAVQTFELLRHYGLFGPLFPATEACLAEEEQGFPPMLIVRALQSTDARIAERKPVTPAFLFAALLWEPVRRRAEALAEEEGDARAALVAGQEVLQAQSATLAVPRRFSTVSQEIWVQQHRFRHMTGRRPFRLLAHPRFRAAYDFMLLRADAGEEDPAVASWWTEFQEADEDRRAQMVSAGAGGNGRRRRRRPRS